jgi:hypothetical protein
MRGDLAESQRGGACRGKLDRQRDPIQMPTDIGDRRQVFCLRREIGIERAGPHHEQLNRAMIERFALAVIASRRHVQGRDAIDLLPVDPQDFAAGDEQRCGRAEADDGLDLVCRGVDDVLAIVQHQ